MGLAIHYYVTYIHLPWYIVKPVLGVSATERRGQGEFRPGPELSYETLW